MAGYLKQLFERNDFLRYRTSAHRRRFSLIQGGITLGIMGLTPAIVAQALSGDRQGFWILISVLGVLAVAFVFATGLLNASIAGITEIPTRDLDEMQLRLRDDALRTSYRVLGAVLLLSLSAPVVWHGATLSRAMVLSMSFDIFLIYLAAPAHILAWRMPDEGDVDEAPDGIAQT